MKLIDADELKKEISKRISQKIKWTMEPDVYSFRADEIVEMIDSVPVLTNIDVIKEFPTIVNAPRGHWKIVDDDDGLKLCECSICGRREEIINFKNYPFCHCGALMDHPGLRYEAEDKNDGGEK